MKSQRFLPFPLSQATAYVLCISLLLTALTPVAASTSTTKGIGAKAQGATPRPTSAPATSGIDNMPRLGLQLYALDTDAGMPTVVASGARLVRVEAGWSSVEPVNVDPSQYFWTNLDAEFARLKANNLSPVVIVLGCPAWACVRDNGPLFDNMEGEFAQFMGAMAARYSQPAYNVHYWEMFNEPDSAGGPGGLWGWGMHGAAYTQMLSQVYSAVKAADPQSAVLLGGLAYDNFFNQGGPFNPAFLSDVLDAGGAQYMDGVAFHYYRENAHAWTDISLKTAEIRALMAAHGGGQIPLVCTETGFSSDPTFNGSEAIQARYLVQVNVHGAAIGLKAQVWFLDRDFESSIPGLQLFTKFGITHLDSSPKPSHTAMHTLSTEVGSGAYLRQLGAEDGVTDSLEGYRFMMEDNTHQVSVIWNNEGTTTLSIPAEQALDMVRVVDINGQQLETSPGPDGTRQITVGLDPIYIEWGIRFIDVQSYSWEYSYVEYLASQGIIGGYDDRTFRPGNPATRGQFSKMIVLGMGWTINPPLTPHFVDVPQDNPFYQYVETAFEHGIIGGYPCGGEGDPCPGDYFHPGADITRAQIAKIVVLSKGWPLLDPEVPTFSDVPRGSTFYTYIETAASHSILGGYQDGTFHPNFNATRAQLSKMLALALQQ